MKLLQMKWLGLLFLSLLLVSSCTSQEKANSSLAKYVFEDAIFTLEIKNLSAAREGLSNNLLLSTLGDFPAYREIKEHCTFLKHVKQNTPGLLIFSRTKQDSLGFLYVTENDLGLFSADSIGPRIAEIIPVENETITRYDYGTSQLFSSIIDNDLLLASSLEILLKDGKLLDIREPNAAFEKRYRTSDKSKAITLYINPKSKDPLLGTFFEDMPGIDQKIFAEWTSFDILSKQNQLSFNGATIVSDSISSKLSLFKNTSPQPNETASFAPLATSAFTSYSFNNYTIFAKNQEQYLGKDKVADSIFNTVVEIGFIHFNSENAILLNTYGTENIVDFLAGMQKGVSDYQGNSIIALSDTNFLNDYFEPIVTDFKANFYTILEDAFIFSSTRSMLQTIITDYKKCATYLKNQDYIAAMKNTADAATVLSISTGESVHQIMRNDPGKTSNLQKSKISDQIIVSQIVADGVLFHSNISAHLKESKTTSSPVTSSVKFELEQPLSSRPQFVLNHLTKKKEIVVQDINNKLYLFSTDGQLLWKKQLKGKVQGAIHQVDIFKNGRLQLAFSTIHEFLVLDRNGKNVALFDKSYTGESLNSLAVFDYDNKREYRFVVTQKDKVFMYDRKGKIVSGFKYTKATAPVVQAPQHIVIGNKDYLTFLLKDGTFMALNRKGEIRVKAKEKINFSGNSLKLHKNTFNITDKNGNLCQIDAQGNVKKIALGLTGSHTTDANTELLVYMNDNLLSINGKKTELELGAYTKPKIFEMGIKTYISVTDTQNQKVYLFDSASKLLPNFPLYGNSEIDLSDIDNDGKLELVTSETENSLVVYQLN